MDKPKHNPKVFSVPSYSTGQKMALCVRTAIPQDSYISEQSDTLFRLKSLRRTCKHCHQGRPPSPPFNRPRLATCVLPQVHEALNQKAASLGTPWDAERVRKAIWSCAMHSRFGIPVPPVSPTGATAASPQETATAASSSGGRGDSNKPRARKGGSGGDADGAEAATKKQKSRPH